MGLGLSLGVRRKYSQALVTMLEQEEFTLYRLAVGDLSTTNAFALNRLIEKFENSSDDAMRIFVAQVISQVGGQRAVLILTHFYQSSSARVREAEFSDEQVYQLYIGALSDKSGAVRRAVVRGLQGILDPSGENFLSRALTLVDDPDLETRSQVLPPLIQSGDFFYLATAVQA